jgi:hypothetical protein
VKYFYPTALELDCNLLTSDIRRQNSQYIFGCSSGDGFVDSKFNFPKLEEFGYISMILYQPRHDLEANRELFKYVAWDYCLEDIKQFAFD